MLNRWVVVTDQNSFMFNRVGCVIVENGDNVTVLFDESLDLLFRRDAVRELPDSDQEGLIAVIDEKSMRLGRLHELSSVGLTVELDGNRNAFFIREQGPVAK